MRLSERIDAIEQALNMGRCACVDVSVEKREYGDTSLPMFIRLCDHLWTQDRGESYEDFAERAKAAALAVHRARSPNEKLRLVAQYPKLTREKWIEKYSHLTTKG